MLQRVLTLMKELLGERQLKRTHAQVCNFASAVPRGWEAVFDAVLKHVTAFTHLRRLLMLRVLQNKGACRLEDLASDVGMSVDAARRHLCKLRRRGVVAADVHTPGGWILIPAPQPPCLQTLLAIILRAITKM
jgi:predicted DNA-binding transcriptional regulator